MLDGEEQPNIKTLVEKLYTYLDQEAVWWSGARSEAFLEYLLDEEGQLQTTSEFTTESIEELYAFTEQRHSIPLHTKEVLDIIYEEAQTFCDGDKPLEEVCSIIRKQVRIYISETM